MKRSGNLRRYKAMLPESHQKLPTRREEREELRNKGQFWTPAWVAKAMVRYAIDSVDSGESGCLLDPATGNGAFFEAWEEIRSGRNGSAFIGFDVDAALLDQGFYKKPYCRVENRDFLLSPPADAFASIVANPPYIRHHRIPKQTKGQLREIAVRNLGFALDGRAGMHVYFLIQALSLLRPSGKLSFIMPADTCEGVFADKLWRWITSRFRLDAVVTFDSEATPFPGVDTNAVVFMIRNRSPVETIAWIRCGKTHCDDLYALVESGFTRRNLKSLVCRRRELREAVATGLSRPENTTSTKFRLSDFARVKRGIATGANGFFWLTRKQAQAAGIPESMLKVAVGRTRDVPGDSLSERDIIALDRAGRPTLLFCPGDRNLKDFPVKVQDYLRHGEEMGLNERPLIKTRRPWYRMEHREAPPFLFAYLGRRNTRFIRNEANAAPLTGFLCVYPHTQFRNSTSELWEALNDPETIENLSLVGKSYGAGAIKVEPRGLERLPIPDRLADGLLAGAGRKRAAKQAAA